MHNRVKRLFGLLGVLLLIAGADSLAPTMAQATAQNSHQIGNRPIDCNVTSTVVARNADGRMVMFAIQNEYLVWTRTEVAAGSGTWSAWTFVDFAKSTMAAQLNGNGLIEMFATSREGTLWHRWQSAPDSGLWSEWEVFGTGMSSYESKMSVTADANGGLTLVALDTFGHPWGRTQYIGSNGSNGGGTWSPWMQSEGAWATMVVQANGNGLLELFGGDAYGIQSHRWELTHNTGSWSAWANFQGPVHGPPAVPPLPHVAPTSTATAAPGGAEMVFFTDAFARIWGRIAYISPNGSNGGGSWSAWGRMDGEMRGITAIGELDGRVELFAIDTSGRLFHRKELQAASGNWSPWQLDAQPDGSVCS